jgi:hypothetical protein
VAILVEQFAIWRHHESNSLVVDKRLIVDRWDVVRWYVERSNGVAEIDGDRWQVRNTHVNPTTVQSFEKAGYNRLDIRKMRS